MTDIKEEMKKVGAGGYLDDDFDKRVKESIESGIPTIYVGGDEEFTHEVAHEIYGKFKIVHTDGTEEIIEGATPLCSCGQSKSKPYCDQTHQQFLADEDNPNSTVLWEYLTNKERYEILNGIKLDHKKINKRHKGAKPPWMSDD